eukprot:scaffold215302_cov19-Prasinocladus_malaysianus.AAC.1
MASGIPPMQHLNQMILYNDLLANVFADMLLQVMGRNSCMEISVNWPPPQTPRGVVVPPNNINHKP